MIPMAESFSPESCFRILAVLIVTMVTYICTGKEKQTEPEYTATQAKEIIAEHIHSERDRAVVTRYLLDKIHFEPLSEEFGLSVRQTKKIVYKCKRIVFEHL